MDGDASKIGFRIEGEALITRMTKHDTNPANNPQPLSRIHK
jgi:hypothetical protein